MKILYGFFCLLFMSAASAQGNLDVLHYKYSLQVNDSNDSLHGEATIRLKIRQPAGSIVLQLASLSKGRGFIIHGFSASVGRRSFSQYEHINDALTIPASQFKITDTIIVHIIYSGIPSDGLIISKNKFGDRTFFADNWPDRAHRWIPCNDRPDDKATCEFIVTAPASYKVVSNGTLISEKLISGNEKRTWWKTDIALPTKVMVIGVARFAIKNYASTPSGIPVSAWIFPQDSAKGFYDYAAATDILNFFTDYIGPFPFEKLANVQSKTIFGGMENASAIFYAEKSVTGLNKATDLLAHEIAHQWFGDMASERSFAHLWLSEGFATYLTNVYLQHASGDGVMKERLMEDRKKIADFVKENTHAVVDSTSDLMELLNANSYDKGGWVLHMLRNELGDKNFQEAIRSYYREFKGGNAETRDFERVVEKVSGRSMRSFFDQWLHTPGIPVLNIAAKQVGDNLVFDVKQEGRIYDIRLEVSIINGDGTSRKEVMSLSKKEQAFSFRTSGAGAHFTLDPDVKLLYVLSKR